MTAGIITGSLTLFLQFSTAVYVVVLVLRYRRRWKGFYLGVLLVLLFFLGVLVYLNVIKGLSLSSYPLGERIFLMLVSGSLLFHVHMVDRHEKMRNEREGELEKLKDRAYSLFENVGVSITEEDVSLIQTEIFKLFGDNPDEKAIDDYFNKNPDEARRLASLIRILDVNEITVELFGASSKGDMILRYALTFTEKSLGTFVNFVKALALNRTSAADETELKTLKGEILQVLMKVSIPKRGEGTAIVSVIDITEHKRIQRAFDREQKRAETYFNIVEVIIVNYDRDGIIRAVNRKGCEVLGYSKEELLGKNWFDTVILPENRGWLKKKFGKIMKGILDYNPDYDEELLKKDGEKVHVTWKAVPIYDKRGKIKSNLCTGVDDTELLNYRSALKKSEFRLRYVEELAKIGYWEVDVERGIEYWSPGDYRILGYNPETVKPSKEVFEAGVHPDDIDRLRKEQELALVNKENGVLHTYRYIAGNKVKYIYDWVYNTFDKNGKLLFSTGFVQDKTEEVLAKKRLEKSLREKDVLLRELHHRTKNNMQVISAMLSLRAGSADDLVVSSAFADIEQKIRAMALAHEKLYKSGDLSSISFAEYFRELLDSFRESFDTKKRGVEIKEDVGEITGLIDTAIPCGLILNELVTNALKYAFPPGRKGVIKVSLKEGENGLLTLCVMDNGVGMKDVLSGMEFESLGIKTIMALGEGQLQGKVEWDTKNGVSCSITFPNDIYKVRINTE